jgi:hypothetical protein
MWLSKCIRMLIFTWVLALATGSFAQTNTLPQISAIEATNYLNQQVLVVDKVVQVAMRSNIWLFHLNQKYPKSPLNAVIRKGYTNSFPNLNDYLGQRVAITGRITESHGRLELAMTTPDQIKILGPTQIYPAPPAAVAATQSIPGSPASASATVAPAVAAPATEPTVASVAAAVPTSPKAPADATRTMKLIAGLLAVIAALLAVGTFVCWKRQIAQAKGPKSVDALAQLPENTPDTLSADAWKERALAAEAMAGKQGQMLREKMIPELAEFAKQSLVQGLFAQRNALIETQHKAHQALAELEARLNTVQAPWHERIRTYETRIAELEKEVETQGEEMRELTRATLTLVRRKLEDERQGGQLHSRFN